MEYTGRILVEDANGCRFTLHEFRVRRFLVRMTAFELDTGEKVTRIDRDTFVIAATGEGLKRVTEP